MQLSEEVMEIKKGILLKKSNQRKCYIDISLCQGMVCDYSRDFYEYYRTLQLGEKKIINEAFKDENRILESQEARDILYRYCKSKIEVYQRPFEIFYEEKIDEDGNKYGKDIITNRIFPIPEKVNGDISVINVETARHTLCDKSKVDVNDNNLNRTFYYRGRDHQGYLTFSDREHNKYYSCSKDKVPFEYSLYSTFNDSCHADSRNPVVVIMKAEVKRYRICVSLNFVHKNANRLEVPLIEKGYANEEEVSKYKQRELNWNMLGGKIRRLGSLNNLKDDISYINNNRRKNSSLLDLINEVESLLIKLSNINSDAYNELYSEYKCIISESSLTETDKYKELEAFKEKVNSNMVISTDGDMAVSLLSNYISKTIDNLNKLGFVNISLDYLIELHKEYLKNEKGYNIQSIQKINNRFNLLYFLYLYSNRNNVDNEKIKESYINDSIKGIINTLQALVNLKVIDGEEFNKEQKMMYASITYEPENTNLDWLLGFIRSFDLKEIEKVKELIK